jgi:hypothetical protein
MGMWKCGGALCIGMWSCGAALCIGMWSCGGALCIGMWSCGGELCMGAVLREWNCGAALCMGAACLGGWKIDIFHMSCGCITAGALGACGTVGAGGSKARGITGCVWPDFSCSQSTTPLSKSACIVCPHLFKKSLDRAAVSSLWSLALKAGSSG